MDVDRASGLVERVVVDYSRAVVGCGALDPDHSILHGTRRLREIDVVDAERLRRAGYIEACGTGQPNSRDPDAFSIRRRNRETTADELRVPGSRAVAGTDDGY